MKLEDLSLEEKIGQKLMFAFHGDEINEQLLTQIHELNVGGVIYFNRNISTYKKVQKLNKDIQKEAKIPLFIGLDQEGGTVQRIIEGIQPFPGAMALSATNKSIRSLCYLVAKDLKNLGFNMNFAPVGDVNNNKDNPVINSRSYSDDPNVVSKYVCEAFQGFQDAGIIPTVKHFPGHGDTSVDSHLSLPIVGKEIRELEEIELKPFKEAIENGVYGIMASHILYPKLDPKYPATLSKKIIDSYLRKKMGFNGLVVTDSLTMGAIHQTYSPREIVTLCANAGVDILIFCGKAEINTQREIYKIFKEEVLNGNIPLSIIDESVERILKYKELINNNNNKLLTNKLFINKNLGKTLSQESVTKVIDNKLLPLNIDDSILVIFPKINLFTLVDNENQKYTSLGSILRSKSNKVDEIIIDSVNDYTQEILNNINKYDKIIFASYNVQNDDYQTKIFELLDKEKTIVVSLRSPYDIYHLNGVKSYICIYEATELALESLSNCLLGKEEFKGKLPIKL